MKSLKSIASNLKPATTHFPPISPHGSNIPTNKTLLSHLLNNNQLDQARRLFAQIPSPDAHLYTMMITAFSRTNHLNDAFHLFNTMPNRDIPSWNTMIKGCLSCGDLNTAGKLFEEMPERNVISWTTMISGLANAGNINTAENLFYQMPHRDTAAWNSMISVYCSSGRVLDARDLFDRMPQRNVISWTAMIGGYDQNGESDQAFVLFQCMLVSGVKPTSTTFACVVTACANLADLTLGTQLHTHVRKIGYLFDTYVSTSLVTMYANSRQIDDSKRVFDEVGDRSVVSWTALVTGYGVNGRHEVALDEYKLMIVSGTSPNQSTFTSALNSCCGLEALDMGLKIHASATKQGFDRDVFVGNSLVVLYSKCGDIDDGLKVFNSMSDRNLVSWNSIIVGCAQNGYPKTALDLFDGMRDSYMQPDGITFVGLLTACSHSMMPDMGRHFFRLLKRNPFVEVKLEHYACMVDVLARSGIFEEAEEFIKNMPMEPNVAVWLALLSGCRVHSNLEVARRTAPKIFDLDPNNSAGHVLLSNIYASAGRWNDVSQIRVMMRCKGIVKIPGHSWITIKEVRHGFVCGDRAHPMTKEIYRKLEWLGAKLKEHGYVYDKTFALHDVDDEQKEAALTYHSEKLAIAFGLLNTVDGSTIRVMKNLRVCCDCHSSIMLISKIVGRQIVLRDSSRFHHFRDGCCSCGGYW